MDKDNFRYVQILEDLGMMTEDNNWAQILLKMTSINRDKKQNTVEITIKMDNKGNDKAIQEMRDYCVTLRNRGLVDITESSTGPYNQKYWVLKYNFQPNN